MLANTPAMLECHYGVPMCGAVLNTLNTRLDAAALAFMLDHGEAKVLIVDREFSGVDRRGAEAREGQAARRSTTTIPNTTARGERIGEIEYEDFLREGDAAYQRSAPLDEWDAIALNYTSGTTGDPKGVVYHHRGANLLAVGNVVTADMGRHPVYLWTLPMFHCNGWCFPVVDQRQGGHACLPAAGARQDDVRPDRRAKSDASLRRADRDVDPAQRDARRRSGRCRMWCASSRRPRRRPPRCFAR